MAWARPLDTNTNHPVLDRLRLAVRFDDKDIVSCLSSVLGIFAGWLHTRGKAIVTLKLA